jgi:hypothetical protein
MSAAANSTDLHFLAHGPVDDHYGQWELADAAGPSTLNSSPKGKRTALISCPGCGAVQSLSCHSIDPKGFISPSFVCNGPRPCGFHGYIKLEGWPNA